MSCKYEYRVTTDVCSRKGCAKQRVKRTKKCRVHVTPADLAAVKARDKHRLIGASNLASRIEGMVK
jgi:hypothetical protein